MRDLFETQTQMLKVLGLSEMTGICKVVVTIGVNQPILMEVTQEVFDDKNLELNHETKKFKIEALEDE